MRCILKCFCWFSWLVFSLPPALGFSFEQADPRWFLCPERFSVISKFIFTKYYLNDLRTDYYIDLYKDVLRVMSPNFKEGDSQTKINFNAYVEEFKALIHSLKNDGYDPAISVIPYRSLSEENPLEKDSYYFIAGEHRIGASLYLGKNIFCEQPSYSHPVNLYDYTLFVANKVKPEYLDLMAYEYAKLKNNSNVVLLYSRINDNAKKAVSLLEKYGKIVCQKKIVLNQTGATNLVRLLYEREERNKGNFWNPDLKGEKDKANSMMLNQSKAEFTVILWECDSLSTNKICKQKIREAYPPFSQDSLHITDTHDEAIYAAQTLFNANSIDFLNSVTPKKFDTFISYAARFKHLLEGHPELQEDYAIDTGAVLSALGLRDCSDFDIVCNPRYVNKYLQFLPSINIDVHNEERLGFGCNLDDLIYNPNNYFYYKGLKFLSRNQILEYKKKRKSGQKDMQDVNALKNM